MTQYEAWQEMLESVAPEVKKLDGPVIVSSVLAPILGRMAPEERAEVLRFFEDCAEGQTSAAQLMREMVNRWVGRSWGPTVIVRLHEALNRSPRLPILLNSLVTTAVSAFEAHLAAVATEYYRAVPQALEAVPREKEKEFSLAELKLLGSIDDAVDLAISRRVDDLLFGNIGGWRKFFKDRVNIDLADVADDWDSVREIFQRRHVIVHNAGLASRRYVNEVQAGGISVGDSVVPTEIYVSDAADQLIILGYLVGLSAWRKLSNEPTKATVSVYHLAYQLLVRGRLRVAKRLCEFGIEIADSAIQAQTLQVNLWLARAGLEGPAAIRAEVDAWDVSASIPRLQLAKACLQGDLDRAFELLVPLVDTGDVSGEDLLEWPLLAEVRADPRFNELAPSIGESLARQEDAVFLASGASVYHLGDCRHRGANMMMVPRENARAAGARACRVCHRSITTGTFGPASPA